MARAMSSLPVPVSPVIRTLESVGATLAIRERTALLVALTAFCALLLHGALWVRLKTEDSLQTRSQALAGKAWWAVGGLTVAITYASFRVQPHLTLSFVERPWGYLFPVIAIA